MELFLSIGISSEILAEYDADSKEELRMRSKLQDNPRMPPAKKGESLHVFTGIYIESMSNFQAAQMV